MIGRDPHPASRVGSHAVVPLCRCRELRVRGVVDQERTLVVTFRLADLSSRCHCKGRPKVTRTTHDSCAPQRLQQFLLQGATGLNEEAAIDRLVWHLVALGARVSTLQPPGNLLRRPLRSALVCHEVRQHSVLGQFTGLGRRAPYPKRSARPDSPDMIPESLLSRNGHPRSTGSITSPHGENVLRVALLRSLRRLRPHGRRPSNFRRLENTVSPLATLFPSISRSAV